MPGSPRAKNVAPSAARHAATGAIVRRSASSVARRVSNSAAKRGRTASRRASALRPSSGRGTPGCSRGRTTPASYRRDVRREARRDYRRWNRSWRNDNRYNWHRYRAQNRRHYNLGRYYAPYRNYSYRRIGIGFSLGSLFFGSRYQINDPWSYRLPQTYGPYRWVRYYDDVLLVNTYTGEVVDVIHDFFW